MFSTAPGIHIHIPEIVQSFHFSSFRGLCVMHGTLQLQEMNVLMVATSDGTSKLYIRCYVSYIAYYILYTFLTLCNLPNIAINLLNYPFIHIITYCFDFKCISKTAQRECRD